MCLCQVAQPVHQPREHVCANLLAYYKVVAILMTGNTGYIIAFVPADANTMLNKFT